MSRLVGRTLQGTSVRPTTKKLCFVKEEVFWNYRWRSITDGGSSSFYGDVRDSDYRCVVLFFKLLWIIVVESADRWAGLAGYFQSKVLFEKKESEALGETTVLQNRMHPSQQKLFDLLGTHCPPPSPVFPLFIRPSLADQLRYGRGFIRPSLADQLRYGRRSPWS